MKLYWKILLVTAGLLIVGVTAVGMYLFQFGGMERLVTTQVNSLLRGTTHLRVTVGDIGGDGFNGLIVRHLEVRYEDSLGSTPLLLASSVRVTYSLRGLLDEDYSFGELQLDSLYARLVERPDGSLLGFDISPGRDTTVRRFDKGRPLELSVANLQISNGIIELLRAKDTITVRDIALQSSLNLESGTLALELDSLRAVIDSPQVTIRNLRGKITAGSTTIAAQDLTLEYDSTRVQLTGAGSVRPLRMSAQVSMTGLDLDILRPMFRVYLTGLVNVDGRLQISDSAITGDARVRGDFLGMPFRDVMTKFAIVDEVLTLDNVRGAIFDSTEVNGSGWISFKQYPEEYAFNGTVQRFDLARLAGEELFSSLNGTVGLSGKSFDLHELRLEIMAQLGASSLSGHDVDSADGRFIVYADSLILDGPVGLTIGETHGVATGKLQYQNMIDLQVKFTSSDIAPIMERYQLLALRGAARGDIHLTGQTLQPNGEFELRSDSLWWDTLFTPSVRATMTLANVFENPSGPLAVDWDSAQWRSVAMGPARAEFLLHDDRLDMLSTELRVGIADINGIGMLELSEGNRSARLDALSIKFLDHSFSLTQPTIFAISDERVSVQSFSVREGNAQMMLNGSVSSDSSVQVDVQLSNVAVEPWVTLFRSDLHTSGIFSGTITAGGTIRRPELMLAASVDSVFYDSLYLGQITGRANYSDGLLVCDSVLLKTPQGRHLVRGYLPMNLSPQAKQIIDRKAPLALTMESIERGFDIVPYWLPSIEDIQGELRAPFQLKGNYDSLELIGAITLADIKVKYVDLIDTLYIDSATVQMQNNRLVLENFTGWTPDFRRKGRRAPAEVDGTITIKSLDSVLYALNISFPREFPIRYELDDIEAVVEGDLAVNGYNRPSVTGNIAVLSMQYRVEFAKAGEGFPLMGALAADEYLDLDIEVEIPSNYYIHNQDIDAEFSGQMNIRRESNLYRYTGEMEVVRGKAYLFDKTFVITPGGTATFNGEDRFNPQLDIIACTIIPSLSDTSETIEQLELCIHVTGTLELPEINPVAGSSFTREDIFPLLIANYYSNQGTRASSSLEQRVQSLVASQVSQIGTSQLGRILGVETFQIDPGNSTRFNVRRTYVTLGLYTLPRLYVYSRSAIEGQELGFEYRFNRTAQLEGLRDRDELYHLNLKLHWEF